MRKLLGALLVLSLATAHVVWGQAPRISGKTEVPTYTLVRLTVVDVPPKTGTLWEVYPPEKVDVATTSADRLEFTGPPGTYQAQILLVTVGPDGVPQLKKLSAKVTIGVEPGPGPGPTPPIPPTPEPTNPFYVSLKVAYGQETGTQKGQECQLLGSVYRDGAAQLIDNPQVVRTAGDLHGYMKKLSTDRLSPGAIPLVRSTIGKELNNAIPTDPGASVAVDRQKIAAKLLQVAGFLELLK